MPDTYRENERRLRATVRTFMSPGVWLVIGSLFLIQLIMRFRVFAEMEPPFPFLHLVLLTVLLASFFYLMAGVSHALARSKNVVSLGAAISSGKTVFANFAWLIIKAGLLSILVFNIAAYVAVLVTGLGLNELMKTYSSVFVLSLGIIGFVFVYWMPKVFVAQDFRLIPTLKAALDILRSRLPRSGFLAVLTVGPSVVSMLLPAETPLVLESMLDVAGGFMGWIAYVYCVEWLQDNPRGVAGLADPA